MKRIIHIVAVIACIIMLSSCTMVNEFLATLGFDTHDYEGEAVVETYSDDSDMALKMADMVKTLTVNSPEMPIFSGTKDAVVKCRDALLNHMLNEHYSKYTGNLDLLDRAKTEYPYLKVAIVIPADDFEDEAYKYFGGKQKVENADGQMFKYLEKVNAYTTAAKPVESVITVECLSLEETEKTYRYRFRCSLDGEQSEEYFALVIKRADDTCYFKYVEKIAQ